MLTNSNTEKIEKYLEELSEEYKDMLLKRLLETSDSIENLSVSELLRIDSEIKKSLILENQKTQYRQRTMISAGMIYAIMGIVLLMSFEMVDSFKYEGMNLFALVLTFLGFMISLVGLMLPNNKLLSSRRVAKKKQDDKSLLEYKVVKTWRALEGIATDIYTEREALSISSIISMFLEDGYIDIYEAKTLKGFLKMRNSIVHDTDNNYSQDEILRMLKEAENILIKLTKTV